MATTYTIKSGDTLSDIAKKNNTTVADIQKANPSITNANKIYAGATINLPGSNTSKESQNASGGGSISIAEASRTPTASTGGDTSGDRDFDEYMSIVKQSAGEMPTFDASYDAELDRMYEKIMNREKFSYDVNEDALYDQYKDIATRQGSMAMEDAIGQSAQLTGGYANSWGQFAGQQAFNQYMQELNSIIPTLEERAYARYAAEGDELYNQYSLAAERRDTAYGRHQDDLANWWQEVSYLTDRADAEYAKEQDAYSRLIDLITTTGYTPSAAELSAAGMTAGEASAYAKYYSQGLDAVSAKSSSASASAGNDVDEEGQTPFKLWNYSGIDKQTGKAVFYDANNEKRLVEVGVNPYTSTRNPDILSKSKDGKTYVVDPSKTFNNGYQPNNISGDPLSRSKWTDEVNGRTQSIWLDSEENAWIWDGSKNKYEEYVINGIQQTRASLEKAFGG